VVVPCIKLVGMATRGEKERGGRRPCCDDCTVEEVLGHQALNVSLEKGGE
jgi:hypothetical protein